MVEHGLDDGHVLTGELEGAVGRLAVGDRFGLDGEGPAQAGDSDADPGPVQAADDDGAHAAPQLAGVLDGGDGAHLGVQPVDAGHQQHLAVEGGVDGGTGLVGLQGEGHDHPGEHHTTRQGQDGKGQALQVGHGGNQLS